jgi:hypothetical protein
VRDRHVDVVDDDREVIDRMAVRPQDDEVLDVRAIELDPPMHPSSKAVVPAGTLNRTARGASAASSSVIFAGGRLRQRRSYCHASPRTSARSRSSRSRSAEQ